MPSPATAPSGGLRAWTAVVLLGSLFFISYVDRLALVVLVEPLKRDLGVSDTQVGLLVGTSFAIVYMTFLAPLSRIADTGNRRNLIVAGALLWNVTTIACGFAADFTQLLICRLGVAIGEAVLMPSAMSIIADLFTRERRATPTTVYALGGGMGAASAVLVAGATLDLMSAQSLVQMAPWRLTMVALGVSGFLLALLFGLLVREPTRIGEREAKAPLKALLTHLAANRRTYACFLGAGGINALVNMGTITWYPSYLVRTYGITPSQAGYWFGSASIIATGIGTMLLPLVAARLNGRTRHDGVIWVGITAVALLAPLMVLALRAPTPLSSLVFAVPAFMLQIGLGTLLTVSMPTLPPAHLRGQVMALYLLTASATALGVGPLLVALLSDRLFPGPHGLGQSLTALAVTFLPIQLLLFAYGRKAFVRTSARAAELEAART